MRVRGAVDCLRVLGLSVGGPAADEEINFMDCVDLLLGLWGSVCIP